METVIVDHSQRVRWDHYVHSTADATSWHLYDWFTVFSRHYGLDYYPIAAVDGSDIRGVLPLYRVRTLRRGTMLMSIPYAVVGGIVGDDATVQRMLLEKAIELSGQLGDIPIVLKQYKHKIEGNLLTDDGYHNLELPLNLGMDRIWEDLPQGTKGLLRQSHQYDLELEYPSTDEAGYYRTLLRHQHLTGTPCPGRKWIRNLLGFGIYKLGLLRHRGTIVAATIIKQYDGSFAFPLTCYLPPRDRGVMFACRLYWELIQKLAQEGFHTHHTGRIRSQESPDDFRIRWNGGRPVKYYYQYHGLGGRPANPSKKGRGRRMFETAWKWTPVALTQWIGPALIKQFP